MWMLKKLIGTTGTGTRRNSSTFSKKLKNNYLL